MYTASNLFAALILTVWLAEAASPQVSTKEEAVGASISESPVSALGLQEALAKALEKNPELATYPAQIRASEARILQASLRVNPELGVEFEDFAGTSPYGGIRELQSTIRMSQVIELGGRRAARRGVAASELELTEKDYELKRVEILAETTARFIDVLSAQRTLILAIQAKKASEAVLRSATERVRVGSATRLEEKRAAVATAQRRVAEQRAARSLEVARHRLAAMWGSAAADFSSVAGDLFDITAPISLEELVKRVSDSPSVARWISEKRLKEAELRLAEAGRMPDLTASGGIRRSAGSNAFSLVAELSLPLPLFDKNQGARREATAMLERTELDRIATESRLRSLLFEMHQGLIGAMIEVEASRREVLPLAEEALAIGEAGYRAGRFSYLEMAGAQQAVLEIKQQMISAAHTYHLLATEIERLTGQGIQPQ